MENHVPHINVPVEFHQGTSESAHERCNRLQRERCAKQHEQPSFGNDALQLFGDEDTSTPRRGIVDKWTQYVDFAMRKCGSKNDWQSQVTTTHNFLCVTRMAKFCC